MAGIIITGDTHGEVRRLNNKNVRKANEGEVPDFVIIAGDFGLIWSQDPSDPAERHWFKWLDEKPWETIVVAGNHENYERIFHLPREEHLGAPMYRASKRVWIAQHGNVYQIGGRRVFMFGGALSIDKAMRSTQHETIFLPKPSASVPIRSVLPNLTPGFAWKSTMPASTHSGFVVTKSSGGRR